MLSRVAEKIYWLARYLERAENTARLILVRHELVLDLPDHVQPDWLLLTESLGIQADTWGHKEQDRTEQAIISYLFGNRENPSSIVSAIAQARENIRITRDALPCALWEEINGLYLSIKNRSNQGLSRSQRHSVLGGVIKSCQQIQGIITGTLNHDQGYHFYCLGQALERLDMSSRIIDAGSYALGGDQDERHAYRNVLWISILRSLSADHMYRLTMRQSIKRACVLEFLFRNRSFPRAIAFCLERIIEAGEKISSSVNMQALTAGITEIIDTRLTTQEDDPALHLLIDQLQLALGQLHQRIDQTWFHPPGLAQQSAQMKQEMVY